jgi:hypothetical protein
MDKETAVHIAIDSIATTSSLVDIFSALLVPTIAIVGLYVAYKQHQINQQRLKHELYDRRVILYKEMKIYFAEITARGTSISYDRIMKMNYDIGEAIFLFDNNINKWVEEIYSKSMDICLLEKQIYNENGIGTLSPRDDRKRIVDKQNKLLKWIRSQEKELEPLFRKYLALK